MRQNDARARLSEFAQDIEFLLISVIQGVALAALAGSAIEPIITLHIEYWPYIASAFLLILIFWSQAILHTLSFIDWPLDLLHNFLYFLASFIEVIAFSQMMHPFAWFAISAVFFILTGVLYSVDLRLIRNHAHRFQGSPARKKLFKDILESQVLDLKVLVPVGMFFNVTACLLIFFYPDVFITRHYHVLFILLQLFFGGLAIVRSLRSFARRLRLITESFD